MDETEENMNKKDTNYGNWVPNKYVYIPGLIGMLFVVVSYFYYPVIILAIIFLMITMYTSYARAQFAPEGGDLQVKIQNLVLDELKWDGDGKLLDIGCGNAPLTIKALKQYPHAYATGIDYWGGMWDFSKDVCEKNAEIEGVENRVTFLKASASDLPFEDESFDAVMSNMVFHEVKDSADKKMVIKEALRVVKKGGVFSFQDIFEEKRIYGNIDDLLDTIMDWGIEEVNFIHTSDYDFIPRSLKLPFMVGNIGIIHGRK
ncbi:MAG: class I SAM-dependent methyltransferase [Methanobacterium sp.]|nr:class I SAM-dependent methyltransferase [Methanobacterium sp.]